MIQGSGSGSWFVVPLACLPQWVLVLHPRAPSQLVAFVLRLLLAALCSAPPGQGCTTFALDLLYRGWLLPGLCVGARACTIYIAYKVLHVYDLSPGLHHCIGLWGLSDLRQRHLLRGGALWGDRDPKPGVRGSSIARAGPLCHQLDWNASEPSWPCTTPRTGNSWEGCKLQWLRVCKTGGSVGHAEKWGHRMPGFATCVGNHGRFAQPLPVHSRGSHGPRKANSGRAAILLIENKALVKEPGRNLARRMPISLGNTQRGPPQRGTPGTSTAIHPGTPAPHGTCIRLWHHRWWMARVMERVSTIWICSWPLLPLHLHRCLWDSLYHMEFRGCRRPCNILCQRCL